MRPFLFFVRFGATFYPPLSVTNFAYVFSSVGS